MRKTKWMNVVCMILLMATTFVFPSNIKAAGLIVTANASTVYVGDTVTFTVSVSNGAGTISVSGAASDSVWFDNSSKSYTVKATSVGSLTVSASGVIADYGTEKDLNVSNSATVNVIARPTSNNNNNSNNSNSNTNTQQPTEKPVEVKKNSDSSLASLSVKEGNLSPEFKAGTTSYKMSLPEGTKSITIEARANDSKASVRGVGKLDVKPGDNDINVVCTAENGSTTTYTIIANVKEKAVATLQLGDQKLDVYANPKGASLENKAFEKTKIKINDVEVPAWKSEAQKLTLLYLNGEDGNDFYIYDEASKKVTSIYRPMGVLGKNIVMINVPAEIQTKEGMKFTSVKIEKQTFEGWTFEDKDMADFSLIYVMDGQGNHVYYQYDKKENTLQRYSGAASVSQSSYEKFVKEKESKEQTLWYVIYGLSAGCVVLLGLSIFFFVRRKPEARARKVKIQKEDYENRFHIEEDD